METLKWVPLFGIDEKWGMDELGKGQVLYLKAEVRGIRSTGIGCFFDDPVHEIFGIQDMSYQSLYHFTVGGPVEDTRLTTLLAY